MPVYALGSLVPRIDPTAYLHPDAVVIGDVEIGPEASIWPCAVLRADSAGIHVGARTSIQDGTVIHVAEGMPTFVGDDVVVGHIVHLEGCRVENNALVGNGAVVLHRAIVGNTALIGSNAVVPAGMQIPPYSMALGVPARIRENAVDPEPLRLAVQSYVERARRYNRELRRID